MFDKLGGVVRLWVTKTGPCIWACIFDLQHGSSFYPLCVLLINHLSPANNKLFSVRLRHGPVIAN